MNLRIPGPTPCPPEVLDSSAQQMINHRGREFGELIERITSRLKKVFYTKNDVLILTASGTGAMEAAIVNFLSPGDTVLATSIGVFGDRFADIAEKYGVNVRRLIKSRGSVVKPQDIEWELDADPNVLAVLITHNETSTGATNDLEELARVVRGFDKLVLVDGISSVGAIPVLTDQWHLDVVVSASQKGWMAPPGLAMIAVSKRAWEAHERSRMPRFYFDLTYSREFLEKKQTPWTPAISVLFGLDTALEMMLSEGMDNVFSRHRRVARHLRDGLKSLGLELFVEEEKYASNTVTAFRVPFGTDAGLVVRLLEDEHGIVIAGGQKELKGEIFRIGHLGLVDERDMDEVIEALGEVLQRTDTADGQKKSG